MKTRVDGLPDLKRRRYLFPLLFAAATLFLASCSNVVSAPIVYKGTVFRIIATSGYSGELVSDSSTTAVSGTSDQDITVVAANGQQYTLTLAKTASDGTTLTLELVTEETVNGTKTSVVADSQSTTDPYVPVRVVLVN